MKIALEKRRFIMYYVDVINCNIKAIIGGVKMIVVYLHKIQKEIVLLHAESVSDDYLHESLL
jgi:hypothetical protein